MMLMVQSVVTEGVALCVAAAAICRLSGMHLITFDGVRHKAPWVAVYLSMLLGAINAVHEVVIGSPSAATLILLCGCGAYLWLSRVTWRAGPPEFMRVPTARERIDDPFGLAAGQKEPE